MLFSAPANEIGEWVAAHGGGFQHPGSYTALGYAHEGVLKGGITWSHYNGRHCLCNIAIDNAGRMPRPLILAGLHYSFHPSQLALRRLTFLVASANIRSQSMVRHLGATLEATLRDADPSGDLLIFALFPESCQLWKRFDERLRKPADRT